jgi:polysaccharide deacetylase family protein (PEP-CTERM system associated)
MPQVLLSRSAPMAEVPLALSPPAGTESVFSIDVEDWYHILQAPGVPAISVWDLLQPRVEKNFNQLLDLLAQHNVRATCFFLGWVAERFPHLVRTAVKGGHEIASHGLAHNLVFQMTARRFRTDSLEARMRIEDIAGCRVRGYRAAGFSVIDRTPWFFDELIEAGYEYDSSVFPGSRGHGGMRAAMRAPHRVDCTNGSLIEFPITVADAASRPTCFFGGGYLRIFPLWLIRRMARAVQAEGRPVIYYIHPREIDPDHPRIKMPIHRRFKSYVNLRSTEYKIARIVSEFPMVTFSEFIRRHGNALEKCHV